MTVAQLVNALGLESLTDDVNMDRQVKSGYTSDLLSDVIANIEEDAAWVTIQRHINILGVAKLKDVAAIVVPAGVTLEAGIIEKAKEERVALLKGNANAFVLSGLIYNALTRG